MPALADDRSARVTAYVAAFDEAVTSGAWAGLAAWFTPEALLRFPGSRAPSAHGREAIQAAYEAQPPTGTIEVLSAREDPALPGVDDVRFVWRSGEPGSILIRWRDGLVDRLDVTLG